MNYLPEVLQKRTQLASRVEELRIEIGIRVENAAGEELTFDKIIECFTAMKQLAKVGLTGGRDFYYNKQRSELLEVLVQLLPLVEAGKPLRAQMVEEGFSWLRDFRYSDFRNRLLVYGWLKVHREDAVESSNKWFSAGTSFSAAEIEEFGHANQHMVHDILIREVNPREYKKMKCPLDDDYGEEFWKFSNQLLAFSTRVNEVTTGVGLVN